MATINLHHLRLFRATAREGTLTAAAKALNISQSAVSTQIKALETDLGHNLFERRGRNLVLTEAGRIALDHADEIFRTAEHLTATFRIAGEQRRVLRIGALATLSRNFQMRFLKPLLGRDDVEVVLRSGTQASLLRALDALSIDVVLTNLVPARDAASPYLVRRISEQRVSLVGTAKRLALAGQGLRTLLTRAPLILPTPETSLRAGFDAIIESMGIVPRIAAEADDMAMIRLLARSDAGVAVIPPIVVQDELGAGLLYELFQLPEITEQFCAVTIARTFPNPLLKDVLDLAEEAAAVV
ncbi:LysR family transcriptional regulator [Erythrobacter sanguineus]|uniref:LysR family transcriptional regulator, transcriptional activator of nhaA n=1 Tax=Erythrobacter sanguineus TaxID=198312 RepID=A0A1M7SA88_9SPHN|nr:LysR family transcriptional regulator [Erythrobacter sanguineus]SHN55507.1 LysR family transcriptional regulator, transcriptional activator of nhaA [Erythrobacter sanguineus]